MGNQAFTKAFVWLPFLIAFAVLGISVIGGGVVYVVTQKQHSQPPSPVDQIFTDTQQSSQTKTYTNAQYGFSLEYPSNLTPDGAPEMGGELGSNISWVPVFSLPPVRGAHGFEGGRVSVSVTDTPSVVATCTEPPKADPEHYAPQSSTITINGRPFLAYISGDVGLGQFTSWEIYKTTHAGKCFLIQILKEGTSAGHLSESDQTVFTTDDKALMAILRPIVQSFKFTDSVSSISVPGMSKYTDTDFGFSFWYPSGWKVSTQSYDKLPTEDTYGKGTSVSKVLQLRDPIASSHGVSIKEVVSLNMSILGDYADNGPLGAYENYYFDKATHTWMVDWDGAPNGAQPSTKPADVSNNTMGGLHIFPGYVRFSEMNIVPLSATHFLAVYDNFSYSVDDDTPGGYDPTTSFKSFVKSIVATDPAVATPVSTAEQIKTIQAEKDAYTNIEKYPYELLHAGKSVYTSKEFLTKEDATAQCKAKIDQYTDNASSYCFWLQTYSQEDEVLYGVASKGADLTVENIKLGNPSPSRNGTQTVSFDVFNRAGMNNAASPANFSYQASTWAVHGIYTTPLGTPVTGSAPVPLPGQSVTLQVTLPASVVNYSTGETYQNFEAYVFVNPNREVDEQEVDDGNNAKTSPVWAVSN